MSKWVQHKSGQGDKWKRIDTERNQDSKSDGWIVESKEGLGHLILPRSEYHECPAPERWIDVTGHCNSFTKGEGKAICIARFLLFLNSEFWRFSGQLVWATVGPPAMLTPAGPGKRPFE
jgi:hypothetical protein